MRPCTGMRRAIARRQVFVAVDSTFSLPKSARPEAALLASCARTRLGAAQADRARDLLSVEIDWDFLRRLAREHGVEALLYRSLHVLSSDRVPPPVMGALRADYHANAAHSLLLLAETAKLLAALHAAGIEAVPLKGPMTALDAYGDVTLRDSVDIDLLVRPREAARAAAVLGCERYGPEHEVVLTDPQRGAFIRLCQHERFVRSDRAIEVELHWRPAPLAYAPAPDTWDLWGRCRLVHRGGREVPLPAPGDHLLLLCLHGYTHLFSCLKWVVDIAELVKSEPGLDHDSALQEADRLGCLRAVLLGYRLAGGLLEAPVPPAVLCRVRADRWVTMAATEVVRRYSRGESLAFGPARQLGDFRLHLLAARGVRARLSFGIRRFAPHSKRDLAWLSLPARLAPLYWLTGPVAAVRHASGPRRAG